MLKTALFWNLNSLTYDFLCCLSNRCIPNKEIIFYFISELVAIFMVKKSNICV